MKNNEALCLDQHNDPSIFKRRFKRFLFIIFVVILLVNSYDIAPVKPEEEILDMNAIIWEYGSDLRSFETDIEGEDNWNCVDWSNAYLDENPEWHVLEIQTDIIIKGIRQNHAVNHMIINDTIMVRDAYWEVQYNFTNWDDLNMKVWKGHIPSGKHFFIRNL